MRARLAALTSQRALWAALGLAVALVALAHPVAGADVWANVGPASPLAGLTSRYPLGNYSLDEHFTAVSAGVFNGVDVSGLLPMIAYFFANELWQFTAWLAKLLIELFAFAFSLDLLSGSPATHGAGALGPVARAIHSIYSAVFGGPWMVLAVSVAGCWAMWKALVQRRYTETAGQLALSLLYIAIALLFVLQPAQTIGQASKWTNAMSGAFLSIARDGEPGSQQQAKEAGADQLFGLLVAQPWAVLQFGGLSHCVRTGSGSSDSEATSVPVQPLPAEAARRLEAGEEVSTGGKTCVNNLRKYGDHFLRFPSETDERNEEFEALQSGDASKLPDADPGKASHSYKLGPADVPAAAAMEKGGQGERLLVAALVFCAELGAFALLGALSVGVIIAQVLLLLLLAFSPIALVAAVIPGRGHQFFVAWLQKLGGYALRKAAYSLILAILLAVCAAISAATSQLGWLFSFGLQCAFFWGVLLQRHSLTNGLIGIVTGPGAPGRDRALNVLALYYGARTTARATRAPRRLAGGALRAPGSVARGAWHRLRGGGGAAGAGGRAVAPLRAEGVPLGGVRYSHHLGDRKGAEGRRVEPSPEDSRSAGAEADPGGTGSRRATPPTGKSVEPPSRRPGAKGKDSAPPSKGEPSGGAAQAGTARRGGARKGAGSKPSSGSRVGDTSPPARDSSRPAAGERSPLGEELRAERERAAKTARKRRAEAGTGAHIRPSRVPAPKRRRRFGKGPRFGRGGGKR
jgi:hypothetical protein